MRLQVLSLLDGAKRPFFFFDDDPDGLCGFLVLYRRNREGLFYPVKSKPEIVEQYAGTVKRACADVVFVLDVAKMQQEFIDAVKVPVVWIDHHPVQDRHQVLHVNPLREGRPSRPTAALAYDLVGSDAWIAAIGALNDQYWPEFIEGVRAEYPVLLPKGVDSIEGARFGAPIGVLARVFSFAMKGTTEEMRRSVHALAKIQSPMEILDQSSEHGKIVWSRYVVVNEEFQHLRAQAQKVRPEEGVWVFLYTPGKYSVTRELADEMISKYPEALLILGREKDGEYRCSMRSRKGPPVKPLLEYALKGVRGYGGGHEQACGACIAVADWGIFMERIRDGLRNYSRSSAAK